MVLALRFEIPLQRVISKAASRIISFVILVFGGILGAPFTILLILYNICNVMSIGMQRF